MLILLLTASKEAPKHDVPIAIFTLDLTPDESRLSVVFDKEALSDGIGGIEQGDAFSYLFTHSVWKFEGKEIVWEGKELNTNAEHIELNLSAPASFKALGKLEIHNSCLLEIISHHTNVIFIQYEGKRRGFRMHKGRKDISVELD